MNCDRSFRRDLTVMWKLAYLAGKTADCRRIELAFEQMFAASTVARFKRECEKFKVDHAKER